jgi:exodeoxyribonuclease VII large subunit
VELFPDDRAPEALGVRRLSLVRLSTEIAKAVAPVGRFAVEGEVHRPSRGATGRVWFTLRDRRSQISVTCPAARARRCRAVAGERVSVTGRLEWTTDQGRLQLVAEEVTPVGAGAVAAAIADARRRLHAEGLLDVRRRPIPRLPELIGVICGTEAAVRADIESVVADRYPGYPVEFVEVTVSGAGASEAIVRALRALDARPEVEVIVLARGGGDAPQLLPFSDEELCRAVAAATTPVVSAIGHEGDRPLCDEVADLRCGTPSLAAGAVVPDRAALESDLARLAGAAGATLDQRFAVAGRQLAAVDRDSALVAGLGVARGRLDRAVSRLDVLHPGRRVAEAGRLLESRRLRLEALSPVRVLERGYAVVRAADGTVLRDTTGVVSGAAIDVQLASGRLAATVDEVTS